MLFGALRVHVQLVRVEDAEVRQAFFIDEDVLGLEGFSQERTQEHFFVRVEGVQGAGDSSEGFFAGFLRERLVLPHVVEQVAVPG